MNIYSSEFHKKSEYCYGETIAIPEKTFDTMFSKFCRVSHLRKISKHNSEFTRQLNTKNRLNILDLP